MMGPIVSSVTSQILGLSQQGPCMFSTDSLASSYNQNLWVG